MRTKEGLGGRRAGELIFYTLLVQTDGVDFRDWMLNEN